MSKESNESSRADKKAPQKTLKEKRAENLLNRQIRTKRGDEKLINNNKF